MEHGSDERGGEERGRMDRLDGCFMWGVGVPFILLIVAGLLAVVWGWGTTGRAAVAAKWVASGVIVFGVAGMVRRVMRVRR